MNTLDRFRTTPGIIIILLLYLATLIVSDFLIGVIGDSPFNINVLIKLICFAFLSFIIYPRVLSKKKTRGPFQDYLNVIGLNTKISPGKIFIVFITCYLLFAGSQLLGSWLYHSSNGIPFRIVFGNHSFLASNSIISGIFEEIVFRGLILTLILRQHSKLKSILISSGIFAAIHLLNLLNPDAESLFVGSQIIWAFSLGAMYAVLFIETKSLWPIILIHYFINALVNVWFPGLDKMTMDLLPYGVLSFGIVPAVLTIFLTQYSRTVVKKA